MHRKSQFEENGRTGPQEVGSLFLQRTFGVASDSGHQKLLRETTLAQAVVGHLADLGVEQAFGVSGGAVALVFDVLVESQEISIHHFRHETGAAFAAAEAHFVSCRPTVVFGTTGPGMLNSLTGIMAARWDGAKVILISGATSAAERGRWASQETSSYTIPQDALYCPGPIFDYAIRLESTAEFPEVARRLSLGIAQAGGFVAHVSLPMSIQRQRLDVPLWPWIALSAPTVQEEDAARCAELLRKSSFAVWVGFGARYAARELKTLVERSGAWVFSSPRGKGVFAESHPNFLGVTGLGGHEAVTEYMVQEKPDWVLVLGTRLGEATSFWDPDMVPAKGFIHVDIDPEVPGTAYPESIVLGIQADVRSFLNQLLQDFPPLGDSKQRANVIRRGQELLTMPLKDRAPVRPQVLMQLIQRRVVQGSNAVVLAESGNSFAWASHRLSFNEPGRYRVSTLFGSMGHAAAGVVGAALACCGKSVALVGDGSMLMSSEISTAVQYQAQAVWIVLNDAGYGMCRDGHESLGLTNEGVDFPQVDFVSLARSVGADGIRVRKEGEVDDALGKALAAQGPFVIDVMIDASEASPLVRRFGSLIRQGSSGDIAG